MLNLEDKEKRGETKVLSFPSLVTFRLLKGQSHGVAGVHMDVGNVLSAVKFRTVAAQAGYRNRGRRHGSRRHRDADRGIDGTEVGQAGFCA